METSISVKEVIDIIRDYESESGKKTREYFGIKNIDHYGLTSPQMKSIAKEIGKNHLLALELWETGIHEAKHIAILIADPKQVTKKMMEKWLRDFNSWDIVDNCCGTLFEKTKFAYDKAIEWTGRKKEFEKRAGFSMMAMIAASRGRAGALLARWYRCRQVERSPRWIPGITRLLRSPMGWPRSPDKSW